MSKETNQYNGIKIKNIWPFYIDGINEKFFENVFSDASKTFINKIFPIIQKNMDAEALEQFQELNNLTRDSKILLMLNLLLNKIVSKTGSKDCDLFQIVNQNRFQNNVYIKSLNLEQDLEYNNYNKSKFDNDLKYDFLIEINPDSYLKKHIDSIQLSFFLDVDLKILSGGFSVNFTDHANNNFLNASQQIYLNTLIKHFIVKQLCPLSLENILLIISNKNEFFQVPNIQTNKLATKDNKKKNSNRTTTPKTNLTILDLQATWIDFINRKFLNAKIHKQKLDKNYFEDTLFYTILMVLLINLALYQELKIYFTNENPEIILKLLDKPIINKEDPNQNVITDFYELAKFLYLNYFSNQTIINWKKIKTTEDLLETLNFQEQKLLDFTLGNPILSVEIYHKKQINTASATALLEKEWMLKYFYLLVIHPEVFNMDLATSNFLTYEQLYVIFHNKTSLNQRFYNLQKVVEKTLCEFNYDLLSFVGDEPSMLIVKNHTVLVSNVLYSNKNMVSSGIYENYFWSQIFIQSRLLKRIKIEQDFNYALIQNPKKPQPEKIKMLDNLAFTWYDDYYGMSQLKPIVDRIEKQINLKQSLETLRIKILQNDQMLKKDWERRVILLAYVVASLIGFINFFGMVYTVLTVTDPAAGLLPANIIIIAIGSLFATTLFVLLIVFAYKAFANYKKQNL